MNVNGWGMGIIQEWDRKRESVWDTKKYEIPNNGGKKKPWRLKRVPKNTSVTQQNRSGYTWILYYIPNQLDRTHVYTMFEITRIFMQKTMVFYMYNMENKREAARNYLLLSCALSCLVLYQFISLFLIMLWLDDIVWKIIII